MTSPNTPNSDNCLVNALLQLKNQFIESYHTNQGDLPKIEHDVQWPSPCEQKPEQKVLKDKEPVCWQPVVISESKLSFDNVESALNITLHQDIKTYFTTLYSDSINASCNEGELSLLFAWNEEDFQRLQENIIGHILMKQRLKQKETVFFAVTDEEDMIISILNETGEVWVERVGCQPHKKLTNSIAEFINQVTVTL